MAFGLWEYGQETFVALPILCMQSGVTIPDDLVSGDKTWTIWKQGGKLNVLVNGEELLKDAYPGDGEETQCIESQFPDWKAKWEAKITAVTFLENVNMEANMRYRIVNRFDGKQEDGENNNGEDGKDNGEGEGEYDKEEDGEKGDAGTRDWSGSTQICHSVWILFSAFVPCLAFLIY